MKQIILIIFLFIFSSCNAQEINRNPFDNRKDVTVQEIQKAISYNLDKAKYYNFRPIQIPNKYLKPPYFSEEHHQRIIEILQNKWKEDELNTYVEAILASTLDTLDPNNGLYDRAKKIAVRDSLPLMRVWDSILLINKKEIEITYLKSEIIPISIIKIAGFLKDKRFIPYLENIIKTGPNHLKIWAKLALARFQVEPYHNEMIQKYEYKENYFGGLQELSFICSKKAIDKILIYTEDNIPRYPISDYPTENNIDYVANGAIYSLAYLYKNNDLAKELQELEKKEFKIEQDWYFPKTIADLNKMREILIKYYGSYSMTEIDCYKVTIDMGW